MLEDDAAYKEGRYEEALRLTFLRVDEVMRKGVAPLCFCRFFTLA